MLQLFKRLIKFSFNYLRRILFFDVNLTRNDFYFLDDHPNKNGHYSIGKKLSLLINTFNEIK
jgi:hypothetical protein